MQPLAALAEPRRVEILRLVWREERRAGDIAAAMPVSFGAVSQHLSVLRAAGLVTVRRAGRERWYAADHVALGPLALVLEQMWADKLGELKRLAEAEQRRLDACAARPPRQTQD
ncbi:metalloregulator ArsR/SmtB family transcription factor [Nannocystis radixulma]|uniref:Metalloregulator ArsR/SmtB family transcription factor n=1 Tax=Nannocystis radixulma TaxID=2995305 RepID=A0ABT5BEZ8_9BACT|nr:metalloregulator ArsR/SmtB family transcription factor [Nannocystis radixulma]MCY1059156.1 metalloregulator ArsR/SmtB family transcription factor [Nannocystis sp. SCPEA4]MDC0672089.1 metalloregulator ArsR/SmtB family transcription factor [Nannocystis radixulma]